MRSAFLSHMKSFLRLPAHTRSVKYEASCAPTMSSAKNRRRLHSFPSSTRGLRGVVAPSSEYRFESTSWDCEAILMEI